MSRGRALAVFVAATGAIVAAGVSLGLGGGSRGPLSETWAGGYELGSAPVVLHMTLSQRGKRLRGTAEIGIAAPPVETPLRQASVHGARVFLTLANGTQLDGRRSGGRITGSARSSSGRGHFELALLRPSPAGELQQAVGAYRFADGAVVSLFVEPLGTHLRILDYGSGKMRQLWQVSRDGFVGGPRLLAPWPIAARVQLIRDSAGSVVALRRNGQKAGRIPLVVKSAAFPNGDVRLVGKLVHPQGAGPFPAVVLVAGSERATRDTFDLWGLFFASRGFGVLSYDKRGVGQSTGRFVATPSRGNLRNLAGDALAGVEWLRRRPDIDGREIGLAGGSQAGWIIPLAASQSSDVAFAAIQSGPVMSVGHERAYSALTGNGSVVPPPTDAEIHAQLDQLPDRGFDPRPALSRLQIPLLWQFGGVDKRQYTPESVANLDTIEAQGGHDFTVRVYAAGAHSLRETRHGLISEELRAARFVPGLFADLSAWLATR